MGKNLISYSLWGDTPMYTVGAIRNAEMVPDIFGPDWISRFYIGNDVPNETVEKLLSLPQTECISLPEENPDWTGMFWRFWPISDPDIDLIIFRDTDSRPSTRDSAAVKEWMDSGKLVHLMRDHPYHTEPMMGGMWGCRAKETFAKLFTSVSLRSRISLGTVFGENQDKKTMKNLINNWLELEKQKSSEVRFKKGIDQHFLRTTMYKALNDDLYIHDAFPEYNFFSGVFEDQRYFNSQAGQDCKKEMITGFPTARGDFEVDKWNDFIGQQFDEFDVPNQEFSDFLKQRDECIYMDWSKE